MAPKSLDINTIGQLATSPEEMLRSYFGIARMAMLNHANGIDSSKVESRWEIKSIGRETTFGKDTRNNTFLAAKLRYLSERMGSELRLHAKRARCISLKLRYADFSTYTRQKTQSQASDTD